MGERALGWSLTGMGVLFWIVPIIAAFGVHGWDPVATIMPETDALQSLFSQQVENMTEVGELRILGDLTTFDPTDHYVRSWERAESKLVSDLGNVLGYVDLGNEGPHHGHAPTYEIFGEAGCKGCSTPDYDNADPTKDCVSPNDGNAPVFEFNAQKGAFSTPLPLDIPKIIGRDDPTNAVVVRSNIDQIKTAFLAAGWEFYYPCEGYTSPEPHTPLGEIADAFLDDDDNQYHVRIFYGGHDDIYGDWYYMGAHYEGQNAVPAVVIPMKFSNPFQFPITVDNMDGDILCAADGVKLGEARLEHQTTIPAGGQDNINIIIGFTYEGFNHLINNHLVGTSIDASLMVDGRIRLKIYEISITAELEQTIPFPSEISVVG